MSHETLPVPEAARTHPASGRRYGPAALVIAWIVLAGSPLAGGLWPVPPPDNTPLCETDGSWIYTGDGPEPVGYVADGGLYPGGALVPTGEHRSYGIAKLAQVVPRGPDGTPDPVGGRVVWASLGMSNTTQEWGAFQRLAETNAFRTSPRLHPFSLAQGGWALDDMVDPVQGTKFWDRLVPGRLADAGVDPREVQVLWLLNAIASPDAGAWPDQILEQKDLLDQVIAIAEERFENLAVVYLSSRSYGGYYKLDQEGDEIPGKVSGSPEPFAYETAFSVKWLIQDQIDALGEPGYDRPFLTWGPYLWANRDDPRVCLDGTEFAGYERDDLEADAKHPSLAGEEKIARLLHGFFRSDNLARSWYLGAPEPRTNLALEATDDTWVDPLDPEATHGSDPSLVADAPTGTRIYLRFDIAALRDRDVDGARLSLRVDDHVSAAGLAIFEVAGDPDWDQATLSWNGSLALPPEPSTARSIENVSRGGVVTIGIDALVRRRLEAGENHLTLVLDRSDDPGDPGVSRFPSTEWSTDGSDGSLLREPPRLIVWVHRPQA